MPKTADNNKPSMYYDFFLYKHAYDKIKFINTKWRVNSNKLSTILGAKHCNTADIDLITKRATEWLRGE